MQEYYTDNQIKFEYDPQINKFAFKKNHVGVTSGDDLEEADYTYTDSNTIFVSNFSGNDTTGDGTQASPYKTVLKGINSCTATKTKVVVLDYYIYAEDISGYSNVYFEGIYSALSADREFSIYHPTSRIATSADGQHITTIPLGNNKTVIAWADADDGNQGKFIITSGVNTIYKSLTEFGATAAVNLQGVVLANGNFVLAYDGQFVIYDATGTLVKAETAVNAAVSTEYCSIAAYSSGGFIISYRDTGDSNYGNYVIYDNSGAVMVSESRFRIAQTEYIQSIGLSNNTVAIAFRDEDDSDKGKFLTIDYSGTTSAETTFNNASTTLYYGAMSLLSNDNFLIAYKDDTSGDCYATAYDEDGNSEVSAFQVDANACTYIASAAITGYFAILYNDGTDSDNNLVIYENDGTSYLTKTQIESNACIYNNISALTNGDLIYAYNDSGDTAMIRWNVHTINELPRHSHRILGYTPSDTNSIFVSSEDSLTGNDTWAGTQKEPNLTIDGAVANVDGTHKLVVIMDSETYTDGGQEMTGNFLGLYAAKGQSSLWNAVQASGNSDYTDAYNIKSVTKLQDNNYDIKCDTFSDGGIVVVYSDHDAANHGKFTILNIDGSVDVAETTFDATATHDIDVAVLANDNFVVIYSKSDQVYFRIFKQDGSSVKAATLLSTGPTLHDEGRVTALNNGNWVGVYSVATGGPGYFVIYDEEGTEVKAETVFETNNVAQTRQGLTVRGLNNDGFVIVYYDGTDNDCNFIIFDEDGTEVISKTQFYNNISHSLEACVLENDTFAICYNQGVGGAGYMNIYDESGNVVLAATLFEAGATGNFEIGCTGLLNNCILIVYADSGDGHKGKFCIMDQDGNLDVSPTEFEAGITTYSSCCTRYDGTIFVSYQDDDDGDDSKFFIRYPYSWHGLKVSSAATINGISINFQNDYLGTRGIWLNSAKPTIKWCHLENITNPTTTIKTGYGIYGNNEADIYNSIIADNDAGIYLGSAVNDAIIQDSQFYRNAGSYAIHLDGTAAGSGDITIEHCDIFNNYGGIRLENNNGTNEILKNNIIHNNDNDGINADNPQAYSYSIMTDSDTNGSAGSSIVLANPLYINEGAVTPSAIDLNIKTQIEGYQTDSPAKDLADDSRNVGSLDVGYVGAITSWTAITVSKPLQGSIDVEYDGAGVTKSQRRDGSTSSNKEAQTEKLTISWDGILNSEFEDIRAMWTCSSSRVRIYMDPTTSPSTYNEYNLEYANLKASPGNYRLAATGVRNVKLIFGMAYTE